MRRARLALILLLLAGCARRVPVASIPPAAPTMPMRALEMVRQPLAIGVMPIGLYAYPWGVPATDWDYFRAAGMAQINSPFYSPHDYIQWPVYADALQARGMKMLASVGEEIFTPGAGIDLVRPIANHPALLAVVLFDEVVWNLEFLGFHGAYGATRQKWLDGVARWRQEMPHIKLVCVEPGILPAISPGWVSLVEIYYRDLDVIAVDHYPFPYCRDIDNCRESMRAAMEPFRRFGKPVWAVMQAAADTDIPAAVLSDFILGSAAGGAVAGWWWSAPGQPDVSGPTWANVALVTRTHGEQYPAPPRHRAFIPIVLRGELLNH